MSAQQEVVENDPSVVEPSKVVVEENEEPEKQVIKVIADEDDEEDEEEEKNETVLEQTDQKAITPAFSEPLPLETFTSEPHMVIAEALDNYFEQDDNLKRQYESNKPVAKLLELPLVKATNPDMPTLIAAVEHCRKLSLDKTKTYVRASPLMQRTTLILRDLPEDVKYLHIKMLLEKEELTSQLTSRVKEIRPELNNTWFVSFANQDDCLKAALWLNLNGKIGDKKVRCRVKSVLPLPVTYNANYSQSEPVFNHYYSYPQYVQQQYGYGNYYPPQQPAQQPPQRRTSNRNRKGRGNNRGRNNNQNYNNNNNNNNNNNINNNNNSTNNNYNGNQRNQTNMKRRSSRQKNRPKTETDNGDIDYPGEFELIDRTNFAQLIREAMMTEPEPSVPVPLQDCPDLKSDTVNDFTFDDGPLALGTAISPYPSAKQGPVSGDGAPPDFNLDGDAKPKKKEKAKEKTKEKAKAVATEVNTTKTTHEVVFNADDQKDEEVLTPPVVESAI